MHTHTDTDTDKQTNVIRCTNNRGIVYSSEIKGTCISVISTYMYVYNIHNKY